MRKVWASPSPDSRVMFTSYTVTSWSAGKGSQVRLPSGHDMDHCSPCGAEGAVGREGGVGSGGEGRTGECSWGGDANTQWYIHIHMFSKFIAFLIA